MADPPTITEAHPPLDLDEVIERIARFGTDHHDRKVATIRRFVDRHAILSYRWGGGWRYRRARDITGQARPEDVGGLIWRDGVPAPIGRANAAGFTVLYLADRRDTALSEIHVEDQQVVVTEFQIRSDRSVMVAPIGEMSQIQRTGRGFLAVEAAGAINSLLNACELSAARSMLIVDAFLLECLSNREDDYELSSTVAMSIYDKLPGVDSIAFPSRRQPGAVNFAVKAATLWENWGITAVQAARARHLAMGYHELSQAVHVTGITNAGALVWSTDPPDDVECILQLDPPWHR